jgi:glycosyltransferase involved in cell wall biosynthesis
MSEPGIELRCLVVVPTYNEAETVESFLHDVLVATADLDARVLVVDDSSPTAR